MKVHDIKLDILKKIILVSEFNVLQKINKLLDDELIVGYTSEGIPLTGNAYQNRLKKAEKQIQLGKSLSQDELEREAELW